MLPGLLLLLRQLGCMQLLFAPAGFSSSICPDITKMDLKTCQGAALVPGNVTESGSRVESSPNSGERDVKMAWKRGRKAANIY